MNLQRIERLGVSPALIENPKNIRYFTGCDIDCALLLIIGNDVYFITDSRYIESARRQLADSTAQVVLLNKPLEQITQLLREHKAYTLFIEGEYQTAVNAKRYGKCCERIVADNTLDSAISGLRAVKDETELDCIRQAQSLTDAAFEHILGFVKVGRTEREIALELEFFMRKNGAASASFDIIAVSGANSSMPHGIPGERKIENGDFLTMDFGCTVGGYCSDMTRTVAIGSVSEKMRTVYETVLAAQKATLALLRAGTTCCDADKAARDIITAAGYGCCFAHATGHAVGLDIHESPSLSPRCADTLKSGMVVTVEPGIYIEGEFGVRIEDMALITDDGCENLTKSDKQLIVL